jgi:thiol-disulfide isomerase/thioredoxin
VTRRSLAVLTIVVVVAIALGASLWYFVGPEHRRMQTASQQSIVGKAQVGRPAPFFEVSTTAGLFDLKKTRKPVFLEVFATWCPHCQRETAVVDRAYRTYGARMDFVAVSGSDTAMDGTSTASQLDVLEWARRFNAAYPVAYDPLLSVANLYLQGGFPTFAIIDKNKRVDYLESGEVAYRDLDAAIRRALR